MIGALARMILWSAVALVAVLGFWLWITSDLTPPMYEGGMLR